MVDVSSSFGPLLSSFGDGMRLLFNLWPLLLLSSLRGALDENINIFKTIFALWCGWAVIYTVCLFLPTTQAALTFTLLPEPLNTYLFFIVGVASATLVWAWEQLKTGAFRHKTGKIHSIEQMLELTPRQFEEMIADLYRFAGHKAQRTGRSGDHGIDVVVESKTGEKWVVQCKRWRGGSVGEPYIRDFYGAMQHEKADKGMIFTTARFSYNARRWAKGKPIALYDRDALLRLWRKSQADRSVHSSSSS
jgi:HJR/Mrr/RecB family endonuclease